MQVEPREFQMEFDRDGPPSAVFSGDRRYRYLLRRWLGSEARPVCCFIMLNPSTADETANDPTVRRCISFAKGWGYGMLLVVNLFGLRSSDPAKLRSSSDPVGPWNDAHILYAANEADLVVCAWGVDGGWRGRAGHVEEMLRAEGVTLHHLGRTRIGQRPRHPLYLSKTTEPVLWG